MPIPLRILRAEAAILFPRQPLPPAQREREAHILLIAEQMFARHIRDDVTFRAVADLAGLAITTIRRYFADIESIIGAIVTRHLATLIQTMQAIPAGPNQQTLRRAAYRAATSGPHAGFTPAHKLLQSRQDFPADIRAPIEALHTELGTLLAGAHAQTALRLLDAPEIPLTHIESMLAACAATDPNPNPAPPPPQPRPTTLAPTTLAPSTLNHLTPPPTPTTRHTLLAGASSPPTINLSG